ncbi:MAG: hypothetical protein ABI068_01095 [Ktedonobacterales bacterium]
MDGRDFAAMRANESAHRSTIVRFIEQVYPYSGIQFHSKRTVKRL